MVSTVVHNTLTTGENHNPFALSYATQAARLADTTLVTADIYKFAIQVADSTVWMLLTVSPNTWANVAVGTSEVTSASNVGSGAGVFKQKTLQDLEFNGIKSENDRIAVALDAVSNDIELTLTEANIVHQNLSGAGTNTHADIDTHIAATIAHGATGAVVGTTNIQTLTNKTLTTPTIASFVNATHGHADAAGGGTIAHSTTTGQTADDHHNELHTVASHSDTTATGAQLNTLVAGANTTLHYHDADRARANHTGTQLAATISDFDTEVTNNADVAANTTHRTSDGTDHTYINQDVRTSASPNFFGCAVNSTGRFSSSTAGALVGQFYPNNTSQTPNTSCFLTGTAANSFIVCEYADRNTDFAHPLQTNPTMWFQAATAAANDWTSVSFANIDCGTGELTLNNTGSGVTVPKNLTLSGVSSSIALESNTQTSGNVVSIISTPGSSSTATVLNLEAQGTNWGSGSGVLRIITDDNSAVPFTVNDGATDVVVFGRGGNLAMFGDLTLSGGGTVLTTNNGNITLTPNGTGITVNGTGTGSHGLNASGDFYNSGRLEVDGPAYLDGYVTLGNSIQLATANAGLFLGSSNQTSLSFKTGQTPDSLMMEVGTASHCFLIVEKGDTTTDFGASYTDPTLRLQSSDATTPAQYVAKHHNQIDAKEIIGTGSEVVEHITPVELADDGSFDLPDATAGFGFFLVGDSEEYAHIAWDSTGVVDLITNSANVVNTDTDTKFCIFDNGTQVRVRNRLGAAKKVVFKYNYWTP
jgi:hypothetical protein